MNGLMADAANIRDGANPPFTLEDFKEIYPQRGSRAGGCVDHVHGAGA